MAGVISAVPPLPPIPITPATRPASCSRRRKHFQRLAHRRDRLAAIGLRKGRGAAARRGMTGGHRRTIDVRRTTGGFHRADVDRHDGDARRAETLGHDRPARAPWCPSWRRRRPDWPIDKTPRGLREGHSPPHRQCPPRVRFSRTLPLTFPVFRSRMRKWTAITKATPDASDLEVTPSVNSGMAPWTSGRWRAPSSLVHARLTASRSPGILQETSGRLRNGQHRRHLHRLINIGRKRASVRPTVSCFAPEVSAQGHDAGMIKKPGNKSAGAMSRPLPNQADQSKAGRWR